MSFLSLPSYLFSFSGEPVAACCLPSLPSYWFGAEEEGGDNDDEDDNGGSSDIYDALLLSSRQGLSGDDNAGDDDCGDNGNGVFFWRIKWRTRI